MLIYDDIFALKMLNGRLSIPKPLHNFHYLGNNLSLESGM